MIYQKEQAARARTHKAAAVYVAVFRCAYLVVGRRPGVSLPVPTKVGLVDSGPNQNVHGQNNERDEEYHVTRNVRRLGQPQVLNGRPKQQGQNEEQCCPLPPPVVDHASQPLYGRIGQAILALIPLAVAQRRSRRSHAGASGAQRPPLEECGRPISGAAHPAGCRRRMIPDGRLAIPGSCNVRIRESGTGKLPYGRGDTRLGRSLSGVVPRRSCCADCNVWNGNLDPGLGRHLLRGGKLEFGHVFVEGSWV